MTTTTLKPPTKSLTADVVLSSLRRNHFAVLSTVGRDGASHSAGVNYGVANSSSGPALYVMTRRHLQKARDIQSDGRVSLVVPIRRRLLWFLPPATIQLRGGAEVLDGNDDVGEAVFRGFWIGRRILNAYERSRKNGETRICFLKITPEPIVRTYMVGSNVWELTRRMGSGAGRVDIGPVHVPTGAAEGISP
jgi:Pyridoxamine 5'-phosphate oxidase